MLQQYYPVQAQYDRYRMIEYEDADNRNSKRLRDVRAKSYQAMYMLSIIFIHYNYSSIMQMDIVGK